LSPEETAAIVSRRQTMDAGTVASIHAQAGGWVAGVRLLVERAEATGLVATLDRPEALEPAFEYFAAEIFDRASESLRRVLLTTAFLPRFTAALAAAVSGDARAGQQIEDLYRRRLFIDRRIGKEVTYQYHDLFRAFLRTRAEQTLGPEAVATLSGNAGQLVLAAGLFEDAYGLFTRAKDWARAEQIFLDNARGLIAQGRWKTLNDWSAALPPERVAANPWVRYWLGRSKVFIDAGDARALLEGAYQSFLISGDAIGQLLASAAVVDALHFEIQNYNAYESWLERLTGSLELQMSGLCLDDELWVHATLMLALTLSCPDNRILPASVAKVEELLPRCADVNLRIVAANMLQYCGAILLAPDAIGIATCAARAVLDSHDLSADRLALYYFAEGYAHFIYGRYEDALACFDRADATIEQNGLAGRTLFAGLWRGLCERAAGHLEAAEAAIARSEKARGGDRGFASFILDHVSALAAFDRGERDGAIARGLAALKRCDEIGNTATCTFHRLDIAWMLIEGGRPEQARKLLASVESQPGLIGALHFGARVALLQAWAAQRMQDPLQRDTYLGRAMALARSERGKVPARLYRWFRQALEDLLPLALQRGIEPEVARALIRECALDPPASLPESWPWPVRIYTLGRFEVQVNDKPLEFGRKAPKRTIALLKALIAMGGRDVATQALCDALWPDLEGDAANEALTSALHRLRGLLGGKEVIRQLEGALSLNGQRCFVDAWTFESGVERPGGETDALRLYRGGFLQSDTEAPWSASMRERLRGKFVRLVQSVARDLEAGARYDDAIELYSRGIEADQLVEPFYQGLMRSYQQLGRRSEAASAYRRLRQTLSITLGVEPGVESQQLFSALRLQ